MSPTFQILAQLALPMLTALPPHVEPNNMKIVLAVQEQVGYELSDDEITVLGIFIAGFRRGIAKERGDNATDNTTRLQIGALTVALGGGVISQSVQ